MKHVMIDLETMGNKPNAAILSIGAISFGEEKGVWRVDHTKAFLVNVNLQSCIDAGLVADASTIIWWLGQSEEARADHKDNEKASPIDVVLGVFHKWFKDVGGVYPWGNGSDFDIAILNNAFDKCSKLRQELRGFEPPWLFWNSRCFRTLKNLHKDIPAPKTEGVKHNALADAVAQAEHACLIFNEQGRRAALIAQNMRTGGVDE